MMLSATTTLAAGPLGHVLDKSLIQGVPAKQAWLTMNTMAMIASATLLVVAMMAAAKSIAAGASTDKPVATSAFGKLVETVVVFLRDDVIRSQLGKETGDKFAPLLLTLFFFILFNNMLGLVPLLDLQHLLGAIVMNDPGFAVVGGTATGRLGVTAAMAVIVFVAWNLHGVKENGVGGWLHHFLGGAPWYMAPVMIPVEIMGTIVKPVALALRLFANMTAGHILLAVLVGFSATAFKDGFSVLLAPVSLIAMAGAVAITFLEIFVGFLQAYIFMFLTVIFISQMSHHHDEEPNADPEHAHA